MSLSLKISIFHARRQSRYYFQRLLRNVADNRLSNTIMLKVNKVTKGEICRSARIICFSDFGAIAICDEDARLKNEPLEGGNRADCYKIEYFAPILHTGAWHHDSSPCRAANASKDSVFQLRPKPRPGVIRGEWRSKRERGARRLCIKL